MPLGWPWHIGRQINSQHAYGRADWVAVFSFLEMPPVLFFVLFIVLLSRSFVRRGNEPNFIPPTKFSSYLRRGTDALGGPDPGAVAVVGGHERGHIYRQPG